MLKSKGHNDYAMRYTYLPGYFSSDECQVLRNLPLPVEKATIQREDYTSEVNTTYRNTLVQTLPSDDEHKWVYDKMAQIISSVNGQYYHLDLRAFSSLIILQYPVGGFFVEHYDIGRAGLSRRKLTSVVFLTPPTDYKGGQLVFMPELPGPGIKAEEGDILFFPSYIQHEVKRVTEGVRFTMVTWSEGPCYK